jgi:hypothetical protein
MKIRFLNLIVVLWISSPKVRANDFGVAGKVTIYQSYVEITVSNKSLNAIFIKDFWQSFSSGRITTVTDRIDYSSRASTNSKLIHYDEFSRGRHWLYLLAESSNKYANTKNFVCLRLPKSEITENSLFKSKNGDQIELSIHTAKADKVPGPQDWKKIKVSFIVSNATESVPNQFKFPDKK